MSTPNISVCICTFKRPILLLRLLGELENQQTDDLFTFSIVIIDNDRLETARPVVMSFRRTTLLNVRHEVEPEQNISLARNKAVLNADGEFLAFIDDDEYPAGDWLLNLFKAMLAYQGDGVLGPVIPHFQDVPPKWVLKGRMFERSRFPSGTVLKALDTRTGNVIFTSNLFRGVGAPFDPRMGRTGGEDVDFYRRMIKKGHTFVWCNDANVYETIKRDRYTRAYHLKRALLRGVSQARLSRPGETGVIRSLAACMVYTMALPFLFLIGHHLFMQYLIKDCDHLGKLLALCGIDILTQRGFS